MSWVPPGPAWLFCPADRPERFHKAADRADVVVLDLEDGVAAEHKADARQALIDVPLDPTKTVVRVNAHGTPEFSADLAALERTDYAVVMLPKCESAEHISEVSPLEVIALVESPLGALTVFDSTSAANAIGVMWGAEDLIAALGGSSSRFPDGNYRAVAQHVRSQSLLAAKARGLFALDSVYLDIPDLDGLRAEAEDSAAVGFDGKVSIHPSHVPVVRTAYAPAESEIEWATEVIDAVGLHRGVFVLDGQMIDAPVIQHARRILARAPIEGHN